jgi:hypothetical protein
VEIREDWLGDELYPGLASFGGFLANGGTATFRTKADLALARSQSNRSGQVIVRLGRVIGGTTSLTIRQLTTLQNPSFFFMPLTVEFLKSAIENDATFEFSLALKRTGKVTYISGAGARDYGKNVEQNIVSLQALGGWYKEGLALDIHGELGDLSVSLENYRNSSYWIDIKIPWSALRFLFYDQFHFIVSNYKLYGERQQINP